MTTQEERTAVIALSGGQDSTTCLYYARAKYPKVLAVSFDYGQRHRVELAVAEAIATEAGVHWDLLTVPALSEMGYAALTSPAIPVEEKASPNSQNTWAATHDLPSTFVPGRNIILLGLAAAYGLPRGADVLVTGVCAMDRAGYPDCRAEFITSLRATISVGMDAPGFEIDAPLLSRTKAETWALADEVGALDAVLDKSHTCYEGDHEHKHEWGYGCGECPACQVRADGYFEWKRGKESGRFGIAAVR